MDIIISIIGALFSWYLTHLYYKKSLKEQAEAIIKLLGEIKNINVSSKESLKFQYIAQGIETYNKLGSPVNFIDNLSISDNEKADIYDAIMLNAKGRLGKSNKYRK